MNSISHRLAVGIADRLLGEEQVVEKVVEVRRGESVRVKAAPEVAEVQVEKFNGQIELGISVNLAPNVRGQHGIVTLRVEAYSGAAAVREAGVVLRGVLREWQEAQAGAARVSGGADEPTRSE